jgi:hypothetical protein
MPVQPFQYVYDTALLLRPGDLRTDRHPNILAETTPMMEGEPGALVVMHFVIPSVANLHAQHKVFIALLPIADRRARHNMRAPDA